MIDFPAFVRACGAPYCDVSNNCFVTAAAAFPSSDKVEALCRWWDDLPADYRVRLSKGEEHVDLETLALRFGFTRAFEATGREIGSFQQLKCAPPIFVVGAFGKWYARGKRGAVRIPSHIPVKAWSVV